MEDGLFIGTDPGQAGINLAEYSGQADSDDAGKLSTGRSLLQPSRVCRTLPIPPNLS